jgi:hypothetical protein
VPGLVIRREKARREQHHSYHRSDRPQGVALRQVLKESMEPLAVRESAIFSGLPLIDRPTDRTCGIWVVDLNTGRTVAFLKFEDAVQEIFTVQVLLHTRFPDLINDDPKILADSFVLPDDALSQLADSLWVPIPRRKGGVATNHLDGVH